MPAKRAYRSAKEWITLLASRRVDESRAAFAKRIGVGPLYLNLVVRRFPEVKKMPAWNDQPAKSPGRPPKADMQKGTRVLAKAPALAAKSGGALAAEVLAKAISPASAEERFFDSLSVALKTGKRLTITFQLSDA